MYVFRTVSWGQSALQGTGDAESQVQQRTRGDGQSSTVSDLNETI